MHAKDHWEKVYSTKATNAVNWFQPHADYSLGLIMTAGVGRDAAIIDVGGGASPLIDDVLENGFTDLTVLDLSAAALAAARKRLGIRASEAHHTPSGTVQQFVYCYCRRISS